MNDWVLPSYTLLRRELVRFFRQPNRVIGALGTPVIFWILIGGGMASSFRPTSMTGTVTSMEYLYPGTLAMIVLFTSIFSTISIIEDRREGFLQGVLVAPVDRSAIVMGKILGGTVVAFLQGILFLILAPLAGIHWSALGFLQALGMTFLLGFALTGLGFVIAWRMESTQGFHAIMNLFLLPMWLLSGAIFPVSGAPWWLGWIMRLNPLTYGVEALRQSLYRGGTGVERDLFSISFPIGITIFFGLFFFVLSLHMVRRSGRRTSSNFP